MSDTFILGLDASIKKTGYAVLNTNGDDIKIIDKGLLKTSTKDGITPLRLMKQQKQVRDKILEHNIKYVGMEAPYFAGNETEKLFALNQFLHQVFYELNIFVVAFPPSTLKKLAIPDMKATEIEKPHMIDAAKCTFGLFDQKIPDDVADAIWAGWFGRRFYYYFIQKTLKESELEDYEKITFCGKHEFKRGMKKGSIEYTGIKYRENEMFFDYKSIKERIKNAEKSN